MIVFLRQEKFKCVNEKNSMIFNMIKKYMVMSIKIVFEIIRQYHSPSDTVIQMRWESFRARLSTYRGFGPCTWTLCPLGTRLCRYEIWDMRHMRRHFPIYPLQLRGMTVSWLPVHRGLGMTRLFAWVIVWWQFSELQCLRLQYVMISLILCSIMYYCYISTWFKLHEFI